MPEVDDDQLRQVTQVAEAVLVIENAPLPLVVILRDSSIALVNRAFCEFLGYLPGELLGRSLQTILADESDFERRWAKVLGAEGVTPERVGRLRRRDGTPVEARISTLVVAADDGSPRYVVGRALAPERLDLGD